MDPKEEKLIKKEGEKDKVIDVKGDNQAKKNNIIEKKKCWNPKCNNIILQLLILISEVITITIIVLSQLLYYERMK